ncbi:MAG: hypothetical protein FWC50_01000 [Planctomycetaceae bacterium]|nr:hypothetical protein [Planctomycetaceae bacterium]
MRGNYRFQIHIHSTDLERMRNVIRMAVVHLKPPDETL